MKIYVLILVAFNFFTIFSCTTNGSLGHYDQKSREVVLQSSSDYRSALPKAKSRSDIQDSKRILKKGLSKNNRDINSMLNLSNIYLVEGELDKSEKMVRKALRVDLKNRAAKKIMAQIYLRRGNYDMATIILNGLDGEKSKDSEVLNMLALVAISEKRNSDALALFRRGLDLNPSNLAIRMNLGVLYVEYRQLAMAAAQFERILKIMPEHNDAKVHMAVILASRGDYKKAKSIYDEVLSRSKNNPLALFNLAVLETQNKNFAEAESLLKRYLNSKYAKKSGNDEIYSLLQEVESRRRIHANKISDEDIQSKAKKVNEGKASPPVAAETLEEDAKLNTIDNDIRSLEKDLE